MMSSDCTRNSSETGSQNSRPLSSIDRRNFLKTAGAGLGVTAIAGCSGSEDGVLTFGCPYVQSGFAANYGESAQFGLEMAQEEINANGGINGQDVELLFRDTELSSQTAIQQVRSLIEEDGADFLIGVDSSGVSLQLAPVVKELQVPWVCTHASTPFLTVPEDDHEQAVGNDYTFRNSCSLSQNHYGAAVTARDQTDAERWTMIGPNYAYGTQSYEYFKGFTQGMGLGYEFLDDSVTLPDLGTDDFTPQIRRVLENDPEGVLISLWGGDLITFLGQAQNTEFFDVVDAPLMMLGAATDVLNPMGDTMPDGLWAGTRYWALPNESSEANQTFVQKFLDQHDKIPSYNAEGAYRGLYLFKKAIEAAGSSNADDVVGSLEGIQHSGPVGEYTVDPDSHQAGVPSSWGKTSYSEERGVSVLEPFDPVDTSPDTLNSLLEEGTGGRWPAGL